jgi:hypothetical protein
LVKSGGSPEQMLYVLEKGTTKAKRRKAREAITKRASEKEPEVAERFTQDMDAAEKAMLSEHIYTLDKEELKEPRQQVAEDFKHDSGWKLASDDDLDDLGFSRKDLRVEGSNFRAQVYMPDHKVFGSEAKPVLVFRGTEATGDWTKGNIPQGLMGRSKYYKQAVILGEKINKKNRPIEITGHSLGGGLASAASKAGNLPATTFNSAGLHKKTVERYGVPTAQQGSDDNVTRYRIEGEVLTHAQEKMPVLRRLPSAVGNTTQTFSKPKSLTAQAEGADAALGTNVAIAEDTDVTLKERINLHGMDMMREAIEDRKVDDLHTLAKQV